MAGSEDRIITFGHELQLSLEEFAGKAVNEEILLPAFAMVRHSGHIRMAPVVCPNGFLDTASGEECKGFFVGVSLLDQTIHQKKMGEVEVEGFIQRKNGGMEELGMIALDVEEENDYQNTFWADTDLGKDLEEVNSNGFLFPDNTIRVKMRVQVPEELFGLDSCFPQFEEKGHADMLDDIISGRNHSRPDFVLKSSLDEKEIKCHRSVLSLASEYFRGVFQQEEEPRVKRMVEDHQSGSFGDSLASLSLDSHPSEYSFKIEKSSTSLEFSGQVLGKVRHWMYKGQSSFEFGAVSASDVLAAANYLLMPDLKSFCEKQLVADVSSTNAWELLKLSDKFDLEILENRAMAVLVESPNVLEQADAEEEFALMCKLAMIFQEVARANKIISFS